MKDRYATEVGPAIRRERSGLPPKKKKSVHENCAWCGGKIEDGVMGVFCLEHRKRNRENTRARISKYREEGLCSKCGKKPAVNQEAKAPLCEECWLKNCARRSLGDQSKWVDLKNLYESQEGLCAYSGIPITLGIDASLDHILPISRFPVDKPEVSQFVWANVQVNYMKNTYTVDEWTGMMRKILDYMEKQHGQEQKLDTRCYKA